MVTTVRTHLLAALLDGLEARNRIGVRLDVDTPEFLTHAVSGPFVVIWDILTEFP
jgi:hypothetical protein